MSLLVEARSLTQLLQRQHRTQDAILGRALLMAEMTFALQEFNQFPWAASLRVANIRDQTLVIYSSSASSLIPLRGQKQSVLDFLNRRFGLDCTQLEAKVRPSLTAQRGV